MDEESYEEWRKQLVRDAAEQAADIVEDRFGRRAVKAGLAVFHSIVSFCWKALATICLWELTKKLPEWARELLK